MSCVARPPSAPPAAHFLTTSCRCAHTKLPGVTVTVFVFVILCVSDIIPRSSHRWWRHVCKGIHYRVKTKSRTDESDEYPRDDHHHQAPSRQLVHPVQNTFLPRPVLNMNSPRGVGRIWPASALQRGRTCTAALLYFLRGVYDVSCRAMQCRLGFPCHVLATPAVQV